MVGEFKGLTQQLLNYFIQRPGIARYKLFF